MNSPYGSGYLGTDAIITARVFSACGLSRADKHSVLSRIRLEIHRIKWLE